MNRFELASPGPLRDKLVRAVAEDKKTATTSLLSDWLLQGDELPHPGERQLVVGSDEKPIGKIEIVGVDQCPLGDIDFETVKLEGEGFLSVEDWRVEHERYWLGEDYDEQRSGWQIPDEAWVVIERFKRV